jgi:hypothetical protein
MNPDNYIKTQGTRDPAQFFPFRGKEEMKEAIAAAREVQPKGFLVVFRPLIPMLPSDELRCVGHAPIPTSSGSNYWKCATCDQSGFNASTVEKRKVA